MSKRHEREEHERGYNREGDFFFKFSALLCAFLMGFYAFGSRFQLCWSRSFARKDISYHARKPNAGQNCFQTITIFFILFFLQYVSLTLFHLCPRRFWKVLLALILSGTSKSRVFEKIYT